MVKAHGSKENWWFFNYWNTRKKLVINHQKKWRWKYYSKGQLISKCPTCWKLCKNKFLCERHIKTVHEKNEIYVCDTCGFKTFHAYSLTAHIQQVHQKYKPNKCDFCDEAFFYKRDKDKHMVKSHGSKESWWFFKSKNL